MYLTDHVCIILAAGLFASVSLIFLMYAVYDIFSKKHKRLALLSSYEERYINGEKYFAPVYEYFEGEKKYTIHSYEFSKEKKIPEGTDTLISITDDFKYFSVKINMSRIIYSGLFFLVSVIILLWEAYFKYK